MSDENEQPNGPITVTAGDGQEVTYSETNGWVTPEGAHADPPAKAEEPEPEPKRTRKSN